jgi:hypothetical protein
MKTITSVFLFTNGSLMVFNQNGEQMPSYQRTRASRDEASQEIDARLLADAPEGCRFHLVDWITGDCASFRKSVFAGLLYYFGNGGKS